MRKVIEGDVDLRKLYLNELFDLSDVEIIGSFNCRDNDLTNLRGAPHTVGGTFNCSDNSFDDINPDHQKLIWYLSFTFFF